MALTLAMWPDLTRFSQRVPVCDRDGVDDPPARNSWTIIGATFSSLIVESGGGVRAEGVEPPGPIVSVADGKVEVGSGRGSSSDRDFVVPAIDPESDPPLVRKLKRAVLDGPRFDAAESVIAHELGLSGRTLRRRLRELGTTYAQTLADARFAFAQRCLADASLSICDVADRAGYSDVSNFRIAFKRWAGCSPRTFRTRLGLGNDPPGLALPRPISGSCTEAPAPTMAGEGL